MEWSCVFNFCVFTAISLRILLSHLNQVHSDDEFHIVCGLGDTPACRKIFYKYNSFYKHVRRKHDDIYKGRSDPPSDGQYLIVPNKQENEPQETCHFESYETGTVTTPNVSAQGLSLESNDMSTMPLQAVVEDQEDNSRERAVLFIER